jgi:hypothetical protein
MYGSRWQMDWWFRILIAFELFYIIILASLVLAFHSFSASDASGLKHFASMWRLIP